jgi:hypothetical protein
MAGTFCPIRRSALLLACSLLASDATRLAAATGQRQAATRAPATQRAVASAPASHVPQVAPASHIVPAPAAACDDAGIVMSDAYAPGSACGACWPLWAQVEYLLWWDKNSDLPPLATTSPPNTTRDNAGVLGFDTTSILFGGDQNTGDARSGGRLTVGLWLDNCQSLAVFGRGFGLETQTLEFAAASTGADILARPFFNAFTDEDDALLLGFPNSITGDVRIAQENDANGAQALLRRAYRQGGNYRIDMVYGYRYLGFDESLSIENSLEFIDATAATFGTRIDQSDLFDLENRFHGGELGLMGHSVDGRWTLDFLATVALGSMNQSATLAGSTTTTPRNGTPVSVNGGLLTQSSNIGVFEDDEFTVVPEATVTLGYFVTPRMDISIGYTFLFVGNVSRPADVIDTAVNLTQQTGSFEGPARPAFLFEDSSYWLQGLNFGLNFRY